MVKPFNHFLDCIVIDNNLCLFINFPIDPNLNLPVMSVKIVALSRNMNIGICSPGLSKILDFNSYPAITESRISRSIVGLLNCNEASRA